MRAGEFTTVDPKARPAILSLDVDIDSHSSPCMIRVFLSRAKTDSFGKGVHIYMGATRCCLCPVAAFLSYLAVRPAGEGPHLILQDGTPLSRERFVKEVKSVLREAHIDHRSYSGYSFRIGAVTSAAAAGVPAYVIKMLARPVELRGVPALYPHNQGGIGRGVECPGPVSTHRCLVLSSCLSLYDGVIFFRPVRFNA